MTASTATPIYISFAMINPTNPGAGANVQPDAQVKASFAPWVAAPFTLTLGSLFVSVISSQHSETRNIENITIVLYLVGLSYFVVQTIGRFVFAQWQSAFLALLRLVACVAATLPAAFASVMLSLGGPSEDGFASDLAIPEGLELSEPLSSPVRAWNPEDSFQSAIREALSKPPGFVPVVTPSLPSLVELVRAHRPLLLRHLASSAAWRVFEEDGALYATRRWKTPSMWSWDLHGYYTEHHFEMPGEPEESYFQTQTTIGLSNKPWAGAWSGATWLHEGSVPAKVSLRKGNYDVNEGRCIIRCGDVVVEIYEESSGLSRRITSAAIEQLEDEFKAVLEGGEFDRALLPDGSIRRGAPLLNLYGSAGIYHVEAWVNPAEEGTVYLKAFEVTRNFQLSTGRLDETSNERVGWSSDPDELFLSNTLVTIYEGDYGQRYAARLELWFKPASGGAARKLIERNFRIEGWQR